MWQHYHNTCIGWFYAYTNTGYVYYTSQASPKLFTADYLSWHSNKENKGREIWGLSIKTIINYQYNSGLASVYINMRYIRSNSQRCTPSRAQGIYHTGLAAQKKRMWHKTHNILAYQTWVGHDIWLGHKGKWIIITSQLQMLILSQLHSNHMRIEKTRLFVSESIYWVNTNADIEHAVEHCSTCLEYQNTQLQESTTSYKVLFKLYKVAGTDIFIINNENLLCIAWLLQ